MSATKTNTVYWIAAEIEPHIIAFNASNDQAERDEIYETHLQVPMQKLVENIVNRFHMDYLYESNENIQAQVLTHVVLQLSKFRPGKGNSFSYFSTVAKYFLIHLNVLGHRKTKREISLDATNNDDKTAPTMLDKLEAPIKDDKTEFVGQVLDWLSNNLDKLFGSNSQDKAIARELIALFDSDIDLDDGVLTRPKLEKLIDTNGIHFLRVRIPRVRQKLRACVNKLKLEYESNGIIPATIRRIVIDADGAKHVSVSAPKRAGELNNSAKLTADQVRDIVSRHKRGDISQRSLSRAYGVGDSVISNILHGYTWSTVTGFAKRKNKRYGNRYI